MQRAGQLIASRTEVIYMLANQLPLIELSDIPSYPVQTAAPRQQSSVPRLQKFIELGKGFRPATSSFYLDVVAISDPNDDLSYHLSPDASEPYVRFSNIYVRIRLVG